MKNIKQKRIELGLTQFDAARLCGVNINTFIRWENGVAKPNEYNMEKLKKLFEGEK